MKQKATKRFFAVLVVVIMALSMLPALAVSSQNFAPLKEAEGTVNTEKRDPTEKVDIMVEVKGNEPLMEVFKVGDIRAAKKSVSSYESKMLSKQDSAENKIEKALGEKIEIIYNHTLLFNGFSFNGEYSWIEKINENVDGVYAFEAPSFEAPEMPEMYTSTGIVRAPAAWDLGYTGEEQLVAVIDTGLRITHEAFSIMPSNVKLTESDIAGVVSGSPLNATGNASQLYYNAKVPFGYDYFYKANTIHHRGTSDGDDHGTHVAGTAVGNNGDDFKGVAPDAQLAVMAVFQAGGGTSATYYLPALEDCVYLGVDAANMSLGAPCGTTDYPESYDRIFDLMREGGVNLTVSSGNSGTTATGNGANENQKAIAPDYGVVGSPSTYPISMSVAAGNNEGMTEGAIVVDGVGMSYSDGGPVDMTLGNLTGEQTYVVVPGVGLPSDYEGVDVTDKVALVSRGESSFTEKVDAAYAAGAKAIIVRNNQPGALNMAVDNYYIPAVAVTQISGQFMVDSAGEDGLGVMTVNVVEATGAPSDFSSRGPTSDLVLKPEIMAPGASIISSIGLGSDNSYAAWDGTSMAAPHVAGGMALLNEYVREMFPTASDERIRELTDAIMMNTATPVRDNDTGFLFSPREQGAGMMNLGAAVTTKAYITVDGSLKPKMEIGSDVDKTGRYTLGFTVHNFGGTAITYDLSYTIQTEKPYKIEAVYGDTEFIKGIPHELNQYASDNAPATVTVPAGGSVDVSFTISLNDAGLAYMEEHFETGMYIEGFAILTAHADGEGYVAPELSVPYLGFYGDWNTPAMFDDGWYWQDNPVHNHPVPNTFGFKSGSDIQGLGLNPYVDMTEAQYLADRNAISPNGDGKLDSVNVGYTGVLRNQSYGHYAINYANGTQSIKQDWTDNGKGFYYSNADIYYQLGYNEMPFPTWAGTEVEDGDSVELEVRADLDNPGYAPELNARGKLLIPVTKDLTAPVAANATVNGSAITLTLTDENYLAYYAVYGNEAMTDELDTAGVFEATRGAQTQVTVTAPAGADYIYLFLGDYAANESKFKVNVNDGTIENITGGSTPGEMEIVIFEEQFAAVPNPAWNIADLDGDTNNWGVFTNPLDAELGYGGEAGFAGSYSYDPSTNTALTPDNWLLSPAGANAITVPDDGNEYFVRFYMACTQYAPEYFSLMVGPADAQSTGQFTALHSEELSDMDYKEFVVSLKDYAGQSIRLAWRHHNCTDGMLLRLDNVQVYYIESGSEPTPTPTPPEPPQGLVFGEYFEENPTDWTLVDEDGDGYNWYWFTNAGLTQGRMEAYEGDGLMVSESYHNDTYTALTPDNYMISPDIEIPANAVEALLSWYVASQDPNYPAEKYSVLVGPAGSTNPADFTEVLHTETISSDQWINRTADLTAYAGETVRIAFRHHDVTDMFVMKLDQVEVFAEVEDVPTPTPEQPTPTPEVPVDPTPTPEVPVDPTPTPEVPVDPTPTPEVPVDPTPTPEAPVEPTPEPEDPPKAGGISLAIGGFALAALGAAGIIAKRKRG